MTVVEEKYILEHTAEARKSQCTQRSSDGNGEDESYGQSLRPVY